MKILISFILILSFVSLNTLAQGRPALGRPHLQAPVVLDGQSLGDVWVYPREGDENFSVQAEPLLSRLKRYLKADLYTQLAGSVRPEGVLTFRDLKAVGFSVGFDEASLEVRLNLPAKYRQPLNLDLNFVEFNQQKYLRPDAHSGYLNLRALQGWQYGSDVESERRPFTGNLELVENIKGFVLESSADYEEGATYEWRRQDTRIRRDDETNMVRYTLGDLTFRSTGFQLTPSIAGVAATREFSIQPYKTLKPLSDTEIIIKRPSLVEIYVNGFLYSQLRLAPGVFNIRDFPLTTGQSSVRIKVRDDLGQEESYDFSMLYENSLLGKGVQEFSYAVGMPWVSSGGDRTYDDSNAFVSLFNRRGITDQFTAGLNFQSFKRQSLLGLELSAVANFGYFSFQAARGAEGSNSSGFAEKLTYRSLDKILGHQVPFFVSLEAENQDVEFTPVTVVENPLADPTRYLRRYDGQLNYRFESSWLWGIGVNLIEYAAQEDQRTYRTNLMMPLGRQFRVEMAYNKVIQTNEEDRFLISLYWNEPQGYYSASSYYDSQQKTSNLSVNRNNRYLYDDYRWNASLQNSESGNTGSISGEYLTQPASVRLDHFSNSQNGVDSNLTSVGLNTGFAWGGSRGAFTQPITDSFVLVHADNLPTDQIVLINPSGEKGQAQLGPRRTVVLREQSSYYLNTLNVDSTSLPPGYLLDQEFYGTQLTYRSGLLLDLNIKKRVMVKGYLQIAGAPVSLAAGDILDAKGQLVDNTFFTNKDGRFFIEGLEPGVYKVMTDRSDIAPFEITVPADVERVLDMGTVQMRKGENQ